MCNVIPNRRMAFTLCLSVLVAGCGIKWATNRVLSNPDAIAKVGAVYDVLTPRDTTERLVFIPGDSIVVEKSDTIYTYGWLLMQKDNDNIFIPPPGGGYQLDNGIYHQVLPDTSNGIEYKLKPDTIRITNTRIIRRTDTIKWQLPPDNRAMARLLDSLGKYTNELNQAKGSIKEKDKGLKTANNRLFWMAGIILVLGIVIGLLIKFKVKS